MQMTMERCWRAHCEVFSDRILGLFDSRVCFFYDDCMGTWLETMVLRTYDASDLYFVFKGLMRYSLPHTRCCMYSIVVCNALVV